MRTIFLAENLGMLVLYVFFTAIIISLIIITMLNFALARRVKNWWQIIAFIVLALLVPVGVCRCVISFIGVL